MAVTKINILHKQSASNNVKPASNVEAGDLINGLVVKKKGKYLYIDTANEGIKKIVNGTGGYIVVLDYGRKYKRNKSGALVMKQDKTSKIVKTEAEAKTLKFEADAIRNGNDINTGKEKVYSFKDALEDYMASPEYLNFNNSQKDHDKNYFKHFLDYFANMEPRLMTRVDIEKYFMWQLERGKRSTAKKTKSGVVSKKEGISVNTISKHKSALKRVWQFIIDSKKYGVTDNIVENASLPKIEIDIDGKKKLVTKIRYNPRPLTLEELNYTLNDAAQNEFDRSILLMIALASIGSLRRSELVGLTYGKCRHDELMTVTDAAMKYGGFNREYYENHPELMLIDTAVMKINNVDEVKLPKGDIIRITAIPDALEKVMEYATEQRMEIYELTGRKLEATDRVYTPLISLIKGKECISEKLSLKWTEYQTRRNHRMEKAGLEPIPEVRLHDLRHTHANLLKIAVPSWEISNNMGHVIPDANTTQKVYWSDREPYRVDIIKFFNENIKIDWDKALHRSINEPGSTLKINGSGHIVISNEELERQREKGKKKFIFKETELEEMFLHSVAE